MYGSVMYVQGWEPLFRVPLGYCQLWSRGGKPVVPTTRNYACNIDRNTIFSTIIIASNIASTYLFLDGLTKEDALDLRRGTRWRHY